MKKTTSSLPDYEPLQRAFHAAFEPELTAIVDSLDVAPGARVLDLACGDGFYTRRLARRSRGRGRVVGIDNDEKVLARARRLSNGEPISFEQGDIYAPPCAARSQDQVLCAMSFISIEDPVRALREVHRVLAPGGSVAILESDEHHHVLLPWPLDVEVALQRAMRDACGGRYSQARKVNGMLREAGFPSPRKKTFAADRQAPFSSAVIAFLTSHLAFLRVLVRPHMTSAELARFDRHADPANAESMFQRLDAELTCLVMLHQARRSPDGPIGTTNAR